MSNNVRALDATCGVAGAGNQLTLLMVALPSEAGEQRKDRTCGAAQASTPP
jgi:hypothetical protein